MSRFLSIFAIAATAGGVALWLGLRERYANPADVVKEAPANRSSYPEACAGIESLRRELGIQLAQSPSEADREPVLERARQLLHRSVASELAPHWMGTRWDFNGTSETPGEGQIACGYFVSTLLRDSGLRVERVRLAQQASGNIIRSLTIAENTTRLVGQSFEDFLDRLSEAGDGLFVIGLDNHVGFISQDSSGARFIHSDGGRNQCVVSEPVETSPTLRRSRWREFANLCSDDALLQKWLLGGRFPTRS